MKTTRQNLMSGVLVAAGLAVALAVPQRANAGDREWATAGKILTGVVVAQVLFGGGPDLSYSRVVVTDRVAVCPPVTRVIYRPVTRPYYYQSWPPRTVVITRQRNSDYSRRSYQSNGRSYGSRNNTREHDRARSSGQQNGRDRRR